MRELCVVIPAYNEELVLGRCILSLLWAGVPRRDIYVVNDASSDETGDLARRWGVRVLNNEVNLGKGGSLDRVLREKRLASRYRYIGFLDADSRVTVDYREIIRETFRKDSSLGVICGQVQSDRGNWISAWRCVLYSVSHATYKEGQSSLGVIFVVPGCAAVWRSDITRKIEWNPPTVCEDMDYTVQVQRQKLGRIIYVSKLITVTQDPRTLSGYWGQVRRWNSGFFQVLKRHNIPFRFSRLDLEIGGITAEGLIFATLAFLSPILWWQIGPQAILGALAADSTFYAIVTLYLSIKRRRLDLLQWFPMFPILRVISMASFLKSFYDVIIRRRSVKWFSVARYETT